MYQPVDVFNDENKSNGNINRFKAHEHPKSLKRQPLKQLNANLAVDSAIQESSTKLTDLNFDCLEYIVRSFSLQDLLFFGGTCVDLKRTACTVFARMFRNHEVFIDCERFPSCKVLSRSQFAHQRCSIGINVEELLPIFGEAITNMTIVNLRSMSKFNRLDKTQLMHDSKIEHLIKKHCQEELLELKFKNCGKQAIVNAEPFAKVTMLSFDRCVLGNEMTNFSYLFPMMRTLELIDCDVDSVRDSISKPYPMLSSFSVMVPLSANSMTASSFKTANLKAFIDHNPCLRSLNLCHWNESAYDAKVLKHASVNLKQLKALTLYHLRYTDFCSEGAIQFTSVRKLTLVNHDHGMGRLDRSLGALVFDTLHKFCIEGEFDSECTTFIARHKTIKKLALFPTGNHDYYPSNDDVQRIASLLPNLENILLGGKRLTACGLLGLITKCDTLLNVKVFRCKITAPIRKLLQYKCSEYGWKLHVDNTIDGITLTFKRKTK